MWRLAREAEDRQAEPRGQGAMPLALRFNDGLDANLGTQTTNEHEFVRFAVVTCCDLGRGLSEAQAAKQAE